MSEDQSSEQVGEVREYRIDSLEEVVENFDNRIQRNEHFRWKVKGAVYAATILGSVILALNQLGIISVSL